MQTQKTDKRTLRTRRLLQKQLVIKLQQQELPYITVRELTEAANINRGTFYLHYKDINDLYQALETSVVEEITSLVQPFLPLNDSAQVFQVTQSVLRYIQENIEPCQALFRTDGTAFLRHILIANRPTQQEVWDVFPSESDIGREYVYDYIVHGFAGIIRKWMDGGMREHPDMVSTIAQELVSRSMGYVKSNPAEER